MRYDAYYENNMRRWPRGRQTYFERGALLSTIRSIFISGACQMTRRHARKFIARARHARHAYHAAMLMTRVAATAATLLNAAKLPDAARHSRHKAESAEDAEMMIFCRDAMRFAV